MINIRIRQEKKSRIKRLFKIHLEIRLTTEEVRNIVNWSFKKHRNQQLLIKTKKKKIWINPDKQLSSEQKKSIIGKETGRLRRKQTINEFNKLVLTPEQALDSISTARCGELTPNEIRSDIFDYPIIGRKYLHLSYQLVEFYSSSLCQKLKPNKMGTNMFISKYESQVYVILRIVAGFLFLWHGSQKLFDFPPAGHETPSYIVIIAGSIELFGGFLVMIGLWTQWAAFINSGVMAFAYWTAHGTHALLPILNHGELAMIYCFLFLFISSKGSGVFSVDHFLQRRKLKQSL